jgi:hypothetical protein
MYLQAKSQQQQKQITSGKLVLRNHFYDYCSPNDDKPEFDGLIIFINIYEARIEILCILYK